MQPPQKQKQVADRDSADRLASDLRALAGPEWHRLHYGVAVSGGPDSMALLWLMATLLPGQVWAATVDHGLRKGSDQEARMVASFCSREHIPHSTLRPAAAIKGSLQAAARAELNERRNRAQAGLAAGEEKYLPARDKGPQRRWVRDYVDASWQPAEFVMGVMVLVILISLLPPSLAIAGFAVAGWAYLVMMAYLILAIGGMILLGMRVKRKVAAKFGSDRVERGLGWYAAMRSLQMRFMRLPKPQVKRGQYPG